MAPPTPDLDVARAVLTTEITGLSALSASLNASFGEAVARLAAATGRIVVTGIGKSGHVARKVAATFASTGSPALFVHPAEASHGDLGMVLPGDAVLALSNSGETAELSDIVAHAKRFGLALIAITGSADSSLARAADVTLLLPAAEEACPVTRAPTTSTTMQMALGDALAVALLRRRGFSESEFRDFHPGGQLGARLRLVRDVMHDGDALPLASPETTMDTAILTITRKRFGCVGVVSADGRLSGMVTDGDLRRAMAADLLSRRVTEVMTPAPRTVAPGQLAAEALRVMNDPARPITAMFVVDAAGAPVGILHIHDLLRAGIA